LIVLRSSARRSPHTDIEARETCWRPRGEPEQGGAAASSRGRLPRSRQTRSAIYICLSTVRPVEDMSWPAPSTACTLRAEGLPRATSQLVPWGSRSAPSCDRSDLLAARGALLLWRRALGQGNKAEHDWNATGEHRGRAWPNVARAWGGLAVVVGVVMKLRLSAERILSGAGHNHLVVAVVMGIAELQLAPRDLMQVSIDLQDHVWLARRAH
jgi:hypothetical protein